MNAYSSRQFLQHGLNQKLMWNNVGESSRYSKLCTSSQIHGCLHLAISIFSSPMYDLILCQLHETDGESFLRGNEDEGDQ